MRRLAPAVMAGVAVVLSVSVALAADYPRKRKKAYVPPPPPPVYVPPPPPAPYDWSGLYIGANVGGGWFPATSEFSVAGFPFASANNNLSGVIAGGQLGYNWQSGPSVLGIEADFQYSGMKAGIASPTCPAFVCGVAAAAGYSQKIPWFGTVRGRLGYAQDIWMIYATGGYAYGRLTSDAAMNVGGFVETVSRSEMRSGWTAGGGIEVAFSRTWTAKMEYLYVDLRTRDGSWTFLGLPVIEDQSRVYGHLVRAGVNYRF